MKLFCENRLRFEEKLWEDNPELLTLDSILELHSDIYLLIADDILPIRQSDIKKGRNDSPTVEQVLRAALYKEIFRLGYRELEYAEKDSKICELFLKLHRRNVFSFQVLQKYISAIRPESLRRVMVELNRIALEELNLSSDIIKRLRVDTTVVESNIHYPTDNSLIWDCIRKLDENMKKLSRHLQQQYRSECKQAKKNFFKINVEKKPQKRKETFEDQLKLFISYMKRAEQKLQEISHCNIGLMDRKVDRLKSIVQSKTLETQLKKWRSGIEGVISNIKRRFELRRSVWKGRRRFESKVFWSVIAYNVHVIPAMLFKQIQLS